MIGPVSHRAQSRPSRMQHASDYFELFGLPVSFIIDMDALAQRYRELQRVVHPDRFASASDGERRMSLQQATLVNEAYQTLRDPLKRAQYLLNLHGVEMGPDHQTTRDTAFLMEQLELREELAGLEGKAEPLAALDDFMGRIEAMVKRQVAELAIRLETPTPEHLQAVRATVHKLQFFNKLHAEAEAMEARLEEAG